MIELESKDAPMDTRKLTTYQSKEMAIFEFWNVTPHLETAVEIGMLLAGTGKVVDFYHLGTVVPFNECYLKSVNNKPTREYKVKCLTSDFIHWIIPTRNEFQIMCGPLTDYELDLAAILKD